ncbi:MAG: hypothetical protein K4305_02255 [Chlorobium sp.]|uniref:hypothetical protein n=1 Tax=Chlorobium sp. TaxID=1095 RepID=UPI002F407A64
MVGRNSGVRRTWEYIGHHVIHYSDLFLLCEQDRNDPECEPPFIANLLPHELYGMISFILKRMREIDTEAMELQRQAKVQQGLIPLQYRGRELQYFRMRLPKTSHHRSTELYNAEFINDTDDGYDTCQGVFVTLERALGFLFREIGFRFGLPPAKFVERILKLYPEYEPLIQRNIEAGRLSRSQETSLTSEASSSGPVLNLHLSDEERSALFQELGRFFSREDHEPLMQLLRGGTAERKLFFKANQNRLVEVFRRLHYHRRLFSTQTHLRNWICHSFTYQSKSGVAPMNANTVWDILTKAKGEPSSRSRICRFDWLPYKTQTVRSRHS